MPDAIILDSSALIAFIYEEKGACMVEEYLPTAEISSVNLAEVASFLIRKGLSLAECLRLLEDLSLTTIAYNSSQAFLTANLIAKTMFKGLSLGDRACLALAMEKDLPVLTADRVWMQIEVDVKIKLIR